MAGITASYRIGPSDIFDSSDLLADANTLNDQINRLDSQNWDNPSQGVYDAFQSYLSEWRRYYKDTFGGTFGSFFAALNNGNRDQLIQFEQRFQNFVQQYQNETGTSIPDVVAPSSGTKDGLGDHLRNQLQPLLPSVNITFVIIAIIAAGVALYLGRKWVARKVLS